ncbi:response regulator [Massilia sp. CF038]|uniref:response regulator n=1 Tax=Massilia sp. CF038 TaxID=1881045 RepID=UPI000922E948|nr:response regulator [Massilia sp. CF038]SHH30248.1 two-component system, NtrC family, sensor kinase [Massilia sp. CF038]
MSIFKAENLAQADQRAALPQPRHSVLVVDDVRANASVMAAILRPHFNLFEAHDADQALALLDALPAGQTLACIISDHRMPRMSGVQLFDLLRQRVPHTQRVMVTGYMDMDALVDAINRAEIYRFVAKPFDATDFLLTVQCAAAAFETVQAQEALEHAQAHQLHELRAALHAARGHQQALEAQLRARSHAPS